MTFGVFERRIRFGAGSFSASTFGSAWAFDEISCWVSEVVDIAAVVDELSLGSKLCRNFRHSRYSFECT